jgi:glutathione S-transferase
LGWHLQVLIPEALPFGSQNDAQMHTASSVVGHSTLQPSTLLPVSQNVSGQEHLWSARATDTGASTPVKEMAFSPSSTPMSSIRFFVSIDASSPCCRAQLTHRHDSAKVARTVSLPELFQFEFSHYNEKARWALDYKHVRHRRRSFLPGPHVLPIMRLSGQKSVPVLRAGAEVIAGSARIIDYIERQYPEPALYPADPEQRRKALEIQQWFDEEVGAYIRRAFFFELLPDDRYLCALFASRRPTLVRRLYGAVFPGIRLVMKRDMRIDAPGAAEGCERTAKALDFVARNAGPQGYLVGDRFSVADLTAAAILCPSVFPPEFPVPIPEPRAKVLNNWLARWARHPGGQWVRDMYTRHRGTSAEVRESA